jgi:hypothetical protein
VGANAVVPNGTDVPSGAMALGVPATIKPDAVRGSFDGIVAGYVANGRFYKETMRRLD